MKPRVRPSHRRRLPTGALRALAGAALWASVAAGAAGQSVWGLSPYRVQVVVALAPSSAWRPTVASDLCGDLVTRCDAAVGSVWDVTAAAAQPDLRRTMLADVEQVKVESLPEKMLDADKVMLLVIKPTVNGHEVTARELDVRTQIWGRTVRRTVWQPCKLRDVAFRAVIDAFSPLAKIEYTKEKGVVLHPRGGSLPAAPDAPTAGRPGQVYLPVVRANDREGKPRAIKQIPWTFLVVDKAAPADLQCTLYSGLHSPLSGRRRGRIEWLALAVNPPKKPSRVILLSRTDPKRVLSGYDVISHAPGSKTTVPVGRTDSHGAVTVAPAKDSPLRLLIVSSGGAPVARLPIVPGLEAELTAAVANDDERLEAEGFITGLQEQLVDLVTRREILLTRARHRIETGRRDDVDSIIAGLESVERKQEQLELQLAEQQKLSVSNDPVMQAKIDKLFADTKKLMAKHLTKVPLDEVARQLRHAGTPSP